MTDKKFSRHALYKDLGVRSQIWVYFWFVSLPFRLVNQGPRSYFERGGGGGGGGGGGAESTFFSVTL